LDKEALSGRAAGEYLAEHALPYSFWYTESASQGGLQQMERHPVEKGGFLV
jgi:hypothetical protein